MIKKREPKYIWSNRYGRNPKEGLHVWLEKNVKDYRRDQLQEWTVLFGKKMGNIQGATNYASSNFYKFRKFVEELNYKLPIKEKA